jgi:hypothetical protein
MYFFKCERVEICIERSHSRICDVGAYMFCDIIDIDADWFVCILRTREQTPNDHTQEARCLYDFNAFGCLDAYVYHYGAATIDWSAFPACFTQYTPTEAILYTWINYMFSKQTGFEREHIVRQIRASHAYERHGLQSVIDKCMETRTPEECADIERYVKSDAYYRRRR